MVFAVGLALGGALSGTAIGLLSGLLPGLPSVGAAGVAAALAVSLAMYDLMVGRVNLPQRRSLIPQEVFFRSQVLGFLRFGIEFGSGARTFVTSASPYILIVTLLGFSASFIEAVVVGAAFGVGRSVGPLQALLGNDRYWSGDLAKTSRLIERSGSVLAATVAVTAGLSMFG